MEKRWLIWNVKLIKEAFEQYEFKVEDYIDLTDQQILQLIDDQVNKDQCKSYDAFVLYIHTHGIEDTIWCSNNKRIDFYKIIEIFKDENCEYLIDKPKIIFFDCRNGE